MTKWHSGGYAPRDGSLILVIEADGSSARTISFRKVNDVTGWFDVDGNYFADKSSDDVSVFGAGWVRLPPMQEQFAREHIEGKD